MALRLVFDARRRAPSRSSAATLSRFAMRRSALIDHEAVDGGVIGKRVRRVAVLSKVGGPYGKDVGAHAGVPLQPPTHQRVELGSVDLVRNDDKQIPVARGLRIPPRTAAKEPDLLGSPAIDDP